MGSSSSKAASNAAKSVSQASHGSKNAAARKYPTSNRNRIPDANRRNGESLGRQNQNKQSSGSRIRDEFQSQETAQENQNPSITTTLSQSASLNARLRTLGPVQANPTLSNSSTFSNPPLLRHSHQNPTSTSTTNSPPPNFIPSESSPSQTIFPSPDGNTTAQRQNPAVSLLTARYRLAEEAEKEFEGYGKSGSEGRRFLDVVVIRQILVLRAKGMADGGIEEVLGLRKGVVGMLGERGLVGAAD